MFVAAEKIRAGDALRYGLLDVVAEDPVAVISKHDYMEIGVHLHSRPTRPRRK